MKMLVAALAAAGLLAMSAASVRADVESTKLAKYAPNVDRSVDRALRFLAADRLKHSSGGSFSGKHGRTNAVAGLVGMAFLSKGHTPRTGPYSHVIRSCVDYVLATPASNGYLGVRGGRMYGHGIATLFLSEVSGMVAPVRQKRIDKVLPKALGVILAAQKVGKARGDDRGGWRYEPTMNSSDISVSGWQIMALRSARLNGAPVPQSAIKNAIAFIDRCKSKHGDGGFYYHPGWWYRRGYWVGGPSTPARTGAGLLCRELGGHHDDAVNRRAGDFILHNIRGNGFIRDSFHAYATYYCSQGMFQLGGKYWEEFAPAMYKYLRQRQKANGAWATTNGEVYPTAMYVLALTVSYRQLPIYQR